MLNFVPTDEVRQCPRCGVCLTVIEPEAKVGNLSISLFGECWWNGKTVPVTPGEAAIVHALASSPNQLFLPDALLNIMGSKSEDPNIISVMIHRIRAKFRAVDPSFDRLENLRHRGYRWTVLQEAPV